jgi:hypothetical protein
MEITNRSCLLNLIFNFLVDANIEENKHKQHFFIKNGVIENGMKKKDHEHI